MFFNKEKYQSLIEQLSLVLYLVCIISILMCGILGGIFIKNISILNYIFGGLVGIVIAAIITIPIRIKIEKMRMKMNSYLLLREIEQKINQK